MNHDELTLDSRTQADLCARVEELAASYTPEWRFDRRDPDIGSTLALIYTGQMADNIRRLNQLPEKYHTEFVNLLGLTLKPAYPASGVAVVELLRRGKSEYPEKSIWAYSGYLYDKITSGTLGPWEVTREFLGK